MNTSSPEDDALSDWKEVEESDDNMLIRLQWYQLEEEFFSYLESQTQTIKEIVCKHLSLRTYEQCSVADRSQWLYGSFNVCIPISISHWLPQQLLFRCPLPYRTGQNGLGLIEEKLRCEAATYEWIAKNCPQVPIPRLWGFGLPDGRAFTSVTSLSGLRAFLERVKQFLNRLRQRSWDRASIPNRFSLALRSGYLLIDYIDKKQGKMLSSVWPPPSAIHRQNLYKSLSRIMLDLAQPFDRIASFTVQDCGRVTLSNRAVTKQIVGLENEGFPAFVKPCPYYTSTYEYLHSLLHYHDVKLTSQPNSARDEVDLRGQMAVLVIQRAVSTLFTQPELQHGPFVFTLPDRHESNILVDDDFNVTCMIDLEFAGIQPLEMLQPPFWISGYGLDDFLGDDKEEAESAFATASNEFVDIFEAEDLRTRHSCGFYTKVMKQMLDKKSYWYFTALKEPRAAYDIFLEHLQPLLAPTHSRGANAIHFQDILSEYWTVDTPSFVAQKLADRQRYLVELRQASC